MKLSKTLSFNPKGKDTPVMVINLKNEMLQEIIEEIEEEHPGKGCSCIEEAISIIKRRMK